MSHKQPLVMDDGLAHLVEVHPLAKLFEPVSVAEAVRLLGTDRRVAQIDVDANGNQVREIYKQNPDTLEVKELVGKQPNKWKLTRFTRLGEYDGSPNIRVEESYV